MSLDKYIKQGEKQIEYLEAIKRRKILSAYKKALNDIRKEIADIYAKYEVAGKLTYSEMSKYNRLNSLFNNISREVKDMSGETHKLTRTLSEETYQASFYRTSWAVEMETGLNLDFGLLNPKVINAAVQMKIDKLTLNKRLVKNRVEITSRIRTEITQGLIRGRSYGEMAKGIKEVLDGNASKALLIAKTEAHRVQNQGKIDSLDYTDDKGIKTENVWDATLDQKTRDDHRKMDGQKINIGEKFTLPDGSKAEAPGMSGVAAQDCNCRCRLRTQLVGYEPKVRRIRGEGIQPYQTYEQWYSKLGG